MNHHISSEIDHVVNTDPGGRNNRAILAAVEDKPACWSAATTIRDAVDDGDTVFVTTGFPIVAAGAPETDGPPGAVALAEAVSALGGDPVFCVDALTADVVSALAADAGLDGAPVERVAVDRGRAIETVRSLVDRHDPACCLAVERPGQCQDGTYRNMTGEDVTEHAGKVDELFGIADERGIPTVGIGDGGNEIGMGSVVDAVMAHVAHGERIASETETDSLVVAGVSNWGAVGVVAALSLQVGRQLLHNGTTERERIATCVASGAVDGVTAARTESVDGLGADVHASLVDLLGGVVNDHLE